jgi:hypothetical protein
MMGRNTGSDPEMAICTPAVREVASVLKVVDS